jgi:hypothetical protein
MTGLSKSFVSRAALLTAAAMVLSPFGAWAQGNANAAKESTGDRWLHVRVISSDDKGETVKVNIPLELAEKVLPAINRDRLHDGKVRINEHDVKDVDLRAIVDAVRTSKDGEFVTVQSNDCDVRVAKIDNHLIVHVVDKKTHEKGEVRKEQVEVKVPMKVVDALFSAGKDELDLVAALRALSASGDQELVSVKDHENTVRVWLDSKNVSD